MDRIFVLQMKFMKYKIFLSMIVHLKCISFVKAFLKKKRFLFLSLFFFASALLVVDGLFLNKKNKKKFLKNSHLSHFSKSFKHSSLSPGVTKKLMFPAQLRIEAVPTAMNKGFLKTMNLKGILSHLRLYSESDIYFKWVIPPNLECVSGELTGHWPIENSSFASEIKIILQESSSSFQLHPMEVSSSPVFLIVTIQQKGVHFNLQSQYDFHLQTAINKAKKNLHKRAQNYFHKRAKNYQPSSYPEKLSDHK